MPDFIDRFGQVGSDGVKFLSAKRQSEITSLLAAGTFFGALAQAFTADRFGRRGSCVSCCSPSDSLKWFCIAQY